MLWSNPRFGFRDALRPLLHRQLDHAAEKKSGRRPNWCAARAAVSSAISCRLLVLMKAQPLTYNKDNQEDKEPLFDTVDTLLDSLLIMADLVATGMTVNVDRMRAAAREGFATATDLADYLVRLGLPFRDAHEAVARAVRHAESQGLRPGRPFAVRITAVFAACGQQRVQRADARRFGRQPQPRRRNGTGASACRREGRARRPAPRSPRKETDSMETPKGLPRVAFLGLGVMGAPMAGHLATAGYPVTVYNRTPEKAQAWLATHGAKGGARSAPTPAAAAARRGTRAVVRRQRSRCARCGAWPRRRTRRHGGQYDPRRSHDRLGTARARTAWPGKKQRCGLSRCAGVGRTSGRRKRQTHRDGRRRRSGICARPAGARAISRVPSR